MLEKYANEYNRKCPIFPSIALRIDKFEIMPDLVMKVTVTLPTHDFSDIEFDKKTLIEIGKKNAIRYLQEQPTTFSIVKKLKINYLYSYYDSKQNHLYDIKITPEDYAAILPPETDNEILQGIIGGAILEMKSIVKQLPIDYGNGVVLSSYEFLEKEKMYDYIYLLTGETEEAVVSDVVSFREKNLLEIKNILNNDPLTKRNLKYGMSFRYTYKDSDGNTLCTFIINKETS
ncbi:MAG: hypothetical protein LBD80_00420 [Tannerella sp.]|jgi:hypothetical protein|nr:hypothetical protein [Tannerella sp.]